MSETGLGEHPPPSSLKFFMIARKEESMGQQNNRIEIGFQFLENSREQWLIRYLKKEKCNLKYVEETSKAQVILRQKEDKKAFELIRNPEEEILCCLPDTLTVPELLREISEKTSVEKNSEGQTLSMALDQPFFSNSNKEKEEGEAGSMEQYSGLYCVFSPAGGCGKTSFSLAYAQELSHRKPDQKVLYWSLQRTEDWPLYFHSASGYNLSDILYSLLSEDTLQLEEVLEKAAQCQENGVYLILPCNDTKDLSNLEEKDLDRLLLFLTRVFGTIICDMNSCYDAFNERIMRKSERIFFIVNDLSMVRIKWENFLEQLSRNQVKEDFLEKASLICICENKADGKALTHGFSGSVYYLPWTNRLCREQNGLLMIRQDSNYYECIRKMV